MTTTITNIVSLPVNISADGIVRVIITNNVPCYFRVEGTELSKITEVSWFPRNPNSVQFEIRQLTLVDDTVGIFMIKVINNYLNATDRAGVVNFTLNDGTGISFPCSTVGQVSYMPLWQSPYAGLDTI